MSKNYKIVLKPGFDKIKDSIAFLGNGFDNPNDALDFLYNKLFAKNFGVKPDKEFYLANEFNDKIIDLPKTAHSYYLLDSKEKLNKIQIKFNKIFSRYKMHKTGFIVPN